MKTTKTQAREIYDSFHAVLRNLNGGTAEENKRQAPRCFERLQEVAAQAAEAVENPAKLFKSSWYWEALNVSIPDRLKSYAVRYGFDDDDEPMPDPWKAWEAKRGIHHAPTQPSLFDQPNAFTLELVKPEATPQP